MGLHCSRGASTAQSCGAGAVRVPLIREPDKEGGGSPAPDKGMTMIVALRALLPHKRTQRLTLPALLAVCDCCMCVRRRSTTPVSRPPPPAAAGAAGAGAAVAGAEAATAAGLEAWTEREAWMRTAVWLPQGGRSRMGRSLRVAGGCVGRCWGRVWGWCMCVGRLRKWNRTAATAISPCAFC